MTYTMQDSAEQDKDDPLTDNFDQWEKFRDAASAEDVSEPAKLRRLAEEAASFALALVKLAVFEKIVDSALLKATPIPEALAKHGTFDLDEKLVKMQMGAIFVTKCSLTLQSDMLGTPDILWEHDRFDAQYDSCRKKAKELRSGGSRLMQRLRPKNHWGRLFLWAAAGYGLWHLITLLRPKVPPPLLFLPGPGLSLPLAVVPRLQPSQLAGRCVPAPSQLQTLRPFAKVRRKLGRRASKAAERPAGVATQIASLLTPGDRRWLLLGICALLCAALTQLAAPPLVAQALFAATAGEGAVLSGKAAELKLVGLLVAVALALALLNGLRAFAFHMARVRFVSRLRERCFRHYMSQDMAFFDKVDASELTSRLTSDCQMVFASLDDVLNFLLRSSSVTFLGSVALVRASPRLALLAALVLLCLADAIAELSRVADEGLAGLATVRALGAEDTHRRLLWEQNQRILSIQQRNSYASGLFGLTSVSLSGISRAMTLVVGGSLVLSPRDRLNGEILTQFLLYLDMVVRGCGILDTALAYLGAQDLGEEVRFEQVTFAYPGRRERPVLKEVSIHCRAGETTALVGTSGSGKNSLINLIQGFYHVQSGQVLVDGVSLEEFLSPLTLKGTSKTLVPLHYVFAPGAAEPLEWQDLDDEWLRAQLGIVGQDQPLGQGI
eukprot:s3977_g4.t1